ncbi:hypothetical protein CSW15_04885, partial [Thermus scotoductus]
MNGLFQGAAHHQGVIIPLGRLGRSGYIGIMRRRFLGVWVGLGLALGQGLLGGGQGHSAAVV